MDAGVPGRATDARVFTESTLPEISARLFGTYPAYHFLGDNGFPLLSWLQSPIGGSTRSDDEVRYDRALSSVRGTIENSFQLLQARWSILHLLGKTPFDPYRFAIIIVVSCMLHNMCRTCDDNWEIVYENTRRKFSNQYYVRSFDKLMQADQKRDTLMTYFLDIN